MPIAESNKVRLRSISIDDALAVTRLLEGDTELALRTATIPVPYTIEVARSFLRTADPEHTLAVIAGDELVGMIGMVHGHEPIEIGYWIGRCYWGKGYASSAVGLLIQEARRRGISRLAAEVFPDNYASSKVLEKNGFVCLGEVERSLPQRGGLRRLLRFQHGL